MPMPTIRPMDRSVPASRIRPATPRARNILGDACWRMFRMLFIVSSWVPPLRMGVAIQRPMKMIMMAIYRPFFSRKSRRLKVY